jgi:hypothetical protein
LFIPVPFDPDTEWGPKTRHPVGGTLNGSRVRGIVQQRNGVHGFLLGAAGLRGGELAAGHQAEVYIEPEGPQRQDLAEDVAAALEASHRAAAFFDSLAQFYRRGVELLEAGIKDYRNQ